MELVFKDVGRFDVVHFHSDYIDFPLVRRHRCPSVTTLHGMVHPPDVGALFDEYREAADAVHRIERLSRATCRRVFEERFDARRMTLDYLDLYGRVIAAV
jgi:glycosyltransferase involved in cell wall biosynthesis